MERTRVTAAATAEAGAGWDGGVRTGAVALGIMRAFYSPARRLHVARPHLARPYLLQRTGEVTCRRPDPMRPRSAHPQAGGRHATHIARASRTISDDRRPC